MNSTHLTEPTRAGVSSLDLLVAHKGEQPSPDSVIPVLPMQRWPPSPSSSARPRCAGCCLAWCWASGANKQMNVLQRHLLKELSEAALLTGCAALWEGDQTEDTPNSCCVLQHTKTSHLSLISITTKTVQLPSSEHLRALSLLQENRKSDRCCPHRIKKKAGPFQQR